MSAVLSKTPLGLLPQQWNSFLPGDGVESPSENGGSYITPRSRHTGYSGPVVCSDVVDFDGVKVWNAIKPSHYINVVIEQSHTGPWKQQEGVNRQQHNSQEFGSDISVTIAQKVVLSICDSGPFYVWCSVFTTPCISSSVNGRANKASRKASRGQLSGGDACFPLQQLLVICLNLQLQIFCRVFFVVSSTLWSSLLTWLKHKKTFQNRHFLLNHFHCL